MYLLCFNANRIRSIALEHQVFTEWHNKLWNVDTSSQQTILVHHEETFRGWNMTLWQSTRTGQHNLSQSRLSITTWCCKKWSKYVVKYLWKMRGPEKYALDMVIWCSWLYQNSPTILKDLNKFLGSPCCNMCKNGAKCHHVMSQRLKKSPGIDLIKLICLIYIKHISRFMI